jgi:phosphatidylserine/phosphatidylglycerophosphate/cardiolipin synthase-like enzyme
MRHIALCLLLFFATPVYAEGASYGVEAAKGQRLGSARIEADLGRLTLAITARGKTWRGPLVRGDQGWIHTGEGFDSVGALGVLEGRRNTPPVRVATYVLRHDGTGILDGEWETRRGRKTIGRGREVLRPVVGVGVLGPLRTSPLMSEVTRAVLKVSSKGTVPKALMLSYGSTVAETHFNHADTIFAEHARLIRGARCEVLLQTFSWRSGGPATQVIDALKALERSQARRGATRPIRVRIVVDDMPLWGGGGPRLRRALKAARLNPRYVDARAKAADHRLLGAMHTKSLVIDGRVALVGSANVGAFFTDASWLESAFRVEGEVVRGLRADFVHLWRTLTGKTLPRVSAPQPQVEDPIPVLIATRRTNGNPFSNDANDPHGRAVVTAIRKARTLIRLFTPNLNDDAVKHAIVYAIRKNHCTVQVILSRGFNETPEMLPTQGGRNIYTAELLYRRLRREGGAKAERRLDIRFYAVNGKTVNGDGGKASHAKYASFDGHLAIVGSGNLDTQSLNHSREVNLVVDSYRHVAVWDNALFVPNFVRGTPVRLGPSQ